MKHKALFCFATIFVIVAPIFFVTLSFIKATSTPVVSVVLSGTTGTTTISSVAVGSTLVVDVRVDNTVDVSPGVNAYSYGLTWDPTVLSCTKVADPGSFLNSGANQGKVTSFTTPADNTAGLLIVGDIILNTANPAACATGSGVLSSVTFKVLTTGQSDLKLQPSDVGVAYLNYPDSTGNSHDITATTANAHYGSSSSSPNPSPISSVNPSPSPSINPSPTPTPTATPNASSPTHGPTAKFSLQNGTTYALGDVLILDGSSSTAGNDSGTLCPITNYAWLVQYPNATTYGAYSGKSVSFIATAQTYLQITLIVTANDTIVSSNSSYFDTSSLSIWINVVPASQLTKIDVFTARDGIGPNVSGDSYGPQELVQLYAYVTYNNAYVAGKLVAFIVLDPNGSVIASLSAETNSTGYAYQEYRTPWLDTNTTDFGTWSVVASVDVSQVVVTDVVSFTYNYLINTNGIVLPAGVHRQNSITLNVTTQCVENFPLWSSLTVTIYDEVNVPIASYVAPNPNQTTGAGQTQVSTTLKIPSWAFVGTATVYVDVLTNSPTLEGVPYCPERTANFQILP